LRIGNSESRPERFFAVSDGMTSCVCGAGPSVLQSQRDWIFQPSGCEARATLGQNRKKPTTLKELNPFRKSLIFNPFRVLILARDYPGLASRNRPNPGLNDPIPSGLTQGSCQYIKEQSNAVPPKTARNPPRLHNALIMKHLRRKSAFFAVYDGMPGGACGAELADLRPPGSSRRKTLPRRANPIILAPLMRSSPGAHPAPHLLRVFPSKFPETRLSHFPFARQPPAAGGRV
jgi:hypothetical protein